MIHPEVHRVLYAERDSDCRFLIGFLGELAGLEITAVRTVSEMWRLACAEQFDLYLLSSRFSDGDGVQLCRRLRTHHPHTPILFYSGNAYEADREKGLAAGASGYLVKPYSEHLMMIIRRCLEVSWRTGGSAVIRESGAPRQIGQTVEISLTDHIHR